MKPPDLVNLLQNYPLINMNKEGTLFHPQHSFCSDEYAQRMCDLYLSSQIDLDNKGKTHKHYRLHARNPHSMEDYLAYDIMCPNCSKLLKPIGRPIDYNELGEMSILFGMLFCADCGNKLYQVRGRGWEHEKEYFVCATYRKIKGGCSSHQVRNVVVEELPPDGIRKITSFARDNEGEFEEMVTKKTQIDLGKSLRDGKRELEQSLARIKKLDDIIQRLYEDNIEGKISDERFAKMTANYEDEQHTLESRVAELKSTMTSEKESALGVDHFIALVRKYTDIKELTAEVIREFIEKIYVYKAERFDGKRIQHIKIVWNCIGEFDLPTISKHEKMA